MLIAASSFCFLVSYEVHLLQIASGRRMLQTLPTTIPAAVFSMPHFDQDGRLNAGIVSSLSRHTSVQR